MNYHSGYMSISTLNVKKLNVENTNHGILNIKLDTCMYIPEYIRELSFPDTVYQYQIWVILQILMRKCYMNFQVLTFVQMLTSKESIDGC